MQKNKKDYWMKQLEKLSHFVKEGLEGLTPDAPQPPVPWEDSVDNISRWLKALPEQNQTEVPEAEFPIPQELINHPGSIGLFCDGACRGNPGPGGFGLMAQDSLGEILFMSSGYAAHTTNNQMELSGAIEALKLLKTHIQEHPELFAGSQLEVPVFLYSDSKYVVDGTSKWLPDWKRQGWKKKDNKAPENLLLWQELSGLVDQYPMLRLLWVKGHSGHPQNERCDRLANEAIDSAYE